MHVVNGTVLHRSLIEEHVLFDEEMFGFTLLSIAIIIIIIILSEI